MESTTLISSSLESYNTFFLAILLVLLTFLSAFFSSTEIAFFSLPSSKIRSWKTASDTRKRRVHEVLSQSRQLLVLIFMLNTIVNVFLQNISSDIFDTPGLDFFGKIVLPLIIILVFGELLPKWIGMTKNQKIALFSSRIYPFLIYVFTPVQKTITNISELFSRLFFFFLKPEPPLKIKELEEIVKHAVHDGVLKDHEALLISNWIDLETKTALDVMIPRSQVMVITSTTIKDIKQALRNSGKNEPSKKHFGRNPSRHELNGIIIGKSADLPEGYIQFSDLFQRDLSSEEALFTQARKQLFYIPETMKVRKLIQEFEEKKTNVACVVDEHDMVLGYVCFDDIESRLLRRDSPQEEYSNTPGVQIISPTSLIVSGAVPLEAINAFFGISLTSLYRSTTIAGWLIEQLDFLPKAGTRFIYDRLVLRVLSSNPRRVEKLFIQLRRDDFAQGKKGLGKKRTKA